MTIQQFEIPFHRQELMARLVKAVPEDWLWISGYLRASKDSVAAKDALKGTILAMAESLNGGRPIIARNESAMNVPELAGVMTDGRMPEFVS